MYVCICNAVTDCGNSCGCCKEMAVDILQQALVRKREDRHQSLLPVMQIG